MPGYRVMKMPAFAAIKSMTAEEFTELQRTCEFNRARPEWHRLGKRLIQVKARVVSKPGR